MRLIEVKDFKVSWGQLPQAERNALPVMEHFHTLKDPLRMALPIQPRQTQATLNHRMLH